MPLHTVAGEEQRRFPRVEAEPGPDLREVTLQPLNGPGAHGNHAVFVPFAASHGECAPGGVEVGEIESAEFELAQAGRVEDLEHRPITHAQGIGDVRDREQGVDLGRVRAPLGKRFSGRGSSSSLAGLWRTTFPQVNHLRECPLRLSNVSV